MDLVEIFFLALILASTAYLFYQFVYKNDIKQIDSEISVQREILLRQSSKDSKRTKAYAHLSIDQLNHLLDELHKIATKRYYRESLDTDQQIMLKKYRRSVDNELRIIKDSVKKQMKKSG